MPTIDEQIRKYEDRQEYFARTVDVLRQQRRLARFLRQEFDTGDGDPVMKTIESLESDVDTLVGKLTEVKDIDRELIGVLNRAKDEFGGDASLPDDVLESDSDRDEIFRSLRETHDELIPTFETMLEIAAERVHEPTPKSDTTDEYVTILTDLVRSQSQHPNPRLNWKQYLEELREYLIEADIEGKQNQPSVDVVEQIGRYLDDEAADELDEQGRERLEDTLDRIDGLVRRR